MNWKGTLLLLCTLSVTGSCARFTDVDLEMTYVRPPKPDQMVRVPVGGVKCDSAEKAIFMATTGFFTDGCLPSRLASGRYKVVSIEHIAQNDVRLRVVMAVDSVGNPLWIPLPDHNWA